MKEYSFTHESWCDTQNNISKTCNCIVSYPLEVIEDLQEENKKLREALEFYANKDNYYYIGASYCAIFYDFEKVRHDRYYDYAGRRARAVLKEIGE